MVFSSRSEMEALTPAFWSICYWVRQWNDIVRFMDIFYSDLREVQVQSSESLELVVVCIAAILKSYAIILVQGHAFGRFY